LCRVNQVVLICLRLGFVPICKLPWGRSRRGTPWPIYKLIANGSFGPDEIKAMTEAYEGALSDLSIANRDDPITELIAKTIVNVTAIGERDPISIKERAINALGIRKPGAIPVHDEADGRQARNSLPNPFSSTG
jgi:hypothetical protein